MSRSEYLVLQLRADLAKVTKERDHAISEIGNLGAQIGQLQAVANRLRVDLVESERRSSPGLAAELATVKAKLKSIDATLEKIETDMGRGTSDTILAAKTKGDEK